MTVGPILSKLIVIIIWLNYFSVFVECYQFKTQLQTNELNAKKKPSDCCTLADYFFFADGMTF